jgi:spatacsin
MNDNEFTELVSISKRPREVGVRLLNLLCKHESLPVGSINALTPTENNDASPVKEWQLSHYGEVEMLIKIHICFNLACHVIGIELVLGICKSKVQEYAANDEFSLLFRLLTGLKCYNKLQYIFEIMIQYDRFELLLQKKNLDESSLIALRVALQTYVIEIIYFTFRTNLFFDCRHLQVYHPNDYEKLQMMFLRFQMYREIAESIERQAYTKLATLKGRTISPLDGPKLLESMQNFMDAADSYFKVY